MVLNVSFVLKNRQIMEWVIVINAPKTLLLHLKFR